MSVIGAGGRRLEGAEKATGATRFTADLEAPGLLHVHLVLSHLPSARIRNIDVAAARSAPGVVDVVTGADLPELEMAGPGMPPPLPRGCYAGHPARRGVAAGAS